MKKRESRRRYRQMLKAIEERIRAREKGLTVEQEDEVRQALAGGTDLDFSGFVGFVLRDLARSVRESVADLGTDKQDAIIIALVEQLCVLTWVVSRDVYDLRDDLRGELEALVEERLGAQRRPKRRGCSKRALRAKRNQPR